ncbi:uncharacterized protein [Heptranchias perlo]|uniref:uncharacterized protein n=1 Tax=Heptranchias perlo TaxID=212740 RepID=UPI00355AA3FC
MSANDIQVVAKVNSSIKMLSEAKEVKSHLDLIMKPYANWEEFLTPGPISIAILGELIFISAAEAFQVKLSTAGKTFRFLRHPGSFHACLMQVTDQGWKAFNKAHKNMDQIRLYSLVVPKHLAKSVDLLGREPKLVKAMLPGPLKSIKKAAEECQQLAASVEEEFTLLIDVVQELLESCASSKTDHHASLDQVRQILAEAKLRKEAVEKVKKRAEAQFTEMSIKMQETHAVYQKAVKMIPSKKNLAGLYLGEYLLDLANKLTSELLTSGSGEALGLVVELGKIAADYLTEKVQHKKSSGSPDTDGSSGNSTSVFLKAIEMVVASWLLQDLISDSGTIDPSKLAGANPQNTNSADCKLMFQRILCKIEQEEDCSAKKAALELCKEGVLTCERLEEITEYGKPDEARLESLATDIRELNVKVLKYFPGIIRSTKAPAFAPQLPNLSRDADVEKVEESLSRIVLDQACFKVEQAKCQLDTARQQYQQMYETKDKATKDLDEVLITMMKCQVKEIDYDSTLKLLVTGLDAMSRVKEQWAKMSNFFQMMSNLIKVSLSDTLTQFTSISGEDEEFSAYHQDTFVKSMIYTEAFQACNIANLCHMISATYVEISQKYLRDQVSSLETYINLSPSDPLFNVKRCKLQEGYTVTKEAINELVKKNKQEFDMQIQQRIDNIDSTLKDPPLAVHQ